MSPDSHYNFSDRPPHLFKLLVGAPGSGKTLFAHKILDKYPDTFYICADDLRLQLCGRTEDQSKNGYIFNHKIPELIKAAGLEKRDILYDATNVSRKARKDILTQAKSFGYKTIVYKLSTSFEECERRNAARERVVPEDVMNRMIANYQEPDLALESYIDMVISVPEHEIGDLSVV